MGTDGPAQHALIRLALRLAGGGLLIATAAIHLDLYLTGYRSIPTIGWLFLLQIIAAFALGAAVLVSGSWLAAAAGALFALATLGGYLLTLWIGLFGFTEVRTTAGIVAGVIEVAAFAALAGLAALSASRTGYVGARRALGRAGRAMGGLPPPRSGPSRWWRWRSSAHRSRRRALRRPPPPAAPCRPSPSAVCRCWQTRRV